MPFDGTPTAPDLSVPSLENLAYALRHRETWPLGFRWNYCSAYGCAIGLAERLWGRQAPLSVVDAPNDSPIFFRCRVPFVWWKPFARRWMKDVQPEHVADAIDRHKTRV